MDRPDNEVAGVIIDEQLAKQLIVAQFPQWANLPVFRVPVDGWDNSTFRLGAEMSIRLPNARRYSGQVAKEQLWLPRLAPLLPLQIPEPLGMGNPGCGYPWSWSIYRWIQGATANRREIGDLCKFARELAEFLLALQRIDASDGPVSGPENFYRGGALSIYDAETRQAISTLGDRIDGQVIAALWDDALSTSWDRPAVWLHGDISVGNLLIHNGKLSAVIDFGTCGVGDPACDVSIAWTLFEGESRQVFRSVLGIDDACWSRARGWALWKSIITLAGSAGTNSLAFLTAQNVANQLLIS